MLNQKLFFLLFYIIILYLCDIVICEVEYRNCTINSAQLNQSLVGQITRDSPIIYNFPLPANIFRGNPQNINIRVEALTTSSNLECPLLFAIRQQEEIYTIKLPYIPDETVYYEPSGSRKRQEQIIYKRAGKTLCTNENLGGNLKSRNITVRISSCSQTPVDYSLVLQLTYNFILPLNREFPVLISPSESKYFGYTFDNPEVDMVRLHAFSEDKICTTLSIQPLHCPVFDDESNVRYKGLWQTMTTTAAMTIENVRNYKSGFIVALVVHKNDDKCTGVEGGPSELVRTKGVKLLIKDESKLSGGIYALCLIIPVIVTFLILLIVCNLFRWRHRWIRKESLKAFPDTDLRNSEPVLLQKYTPNPNGSYIQKSLFDQNKSAIPSTISVQQDQQETDGDLDDPLNVRYSVESNSEGAVLKDKLSPTMELPLEQFPLNSVIRVSEKKRVHFKADICIGDFVSQIPRLGQKTSKRFYWTIVIVSVFYSIPVYQLILHYLRFLYRTGEYDICYYNFLCAHRLGIIIDFNHFWSNISYIIFGLGFVWIVRRRDNNFKKLSKSNQNQNQVHLLSQSEDNENESCAENCWLCFPQIRGDPNYGIFPHFGVFYSLGIALFMEGILSSAYHLCPNQSSFQFDTCFMYIIAVLIILKVYQFRHPMHIGANSTFGFLALFVFLSLVGQILEFDRNSSIGVFRRLFYIFILVIVALISLYYYGIGYIKDDQERSILDWRLFLNLGQLRVVPLKVERLVLPAISSFLSIAVIIYSEISVDLGFGSFLLYILIGNVLGFVIYYVAIMKPLHGEFKNGFWVQPTLYFISALVIGGIAIFYFLDSSSAWEKSASESRAENNAECEPLWFSFYPFYDTHDVWHFLSAAALFLAFMGLLTTDDDLLLIHQNDIPVF